jgi:hypothetical protein
MPLTAIFSDSRQELQQSDIHTFVVLKSSYSVKCPDIVCSVMQINGELPASYATVRFNAYACARIQVGNH